MRRSSVDFVWGGSKIKIVWDAISEKAIREDWNNMLYNINRYVQIINL